MVSYFNFLLTKFKDKLDQKNLNKILKLIGLFLIMIGIILFFQLLITYLDDLSLNVEQVPPEIGINDNNNVLGLLNETI